MSEEKQARFARAQTVKIAHEDTLMEKANVVGIAVGVRKQGGHYTDEVALIVMVRQKVPREQLAPDDRIPAAIDGIPVDVQQVGEIRAQ